MCSILTKQQILPRARTTHPQQSFHFKKNTEDLKIKKNGQFLNIFKNNRQKENLGNNFFLNSL